MRRMQISVLDHSGVSEGQQPGQAIRDSLALARHVERLGYHRYWVSEHHGNAAMAGTAPEVLLAAVAATTSHIRVGSGGVMLPHYASLKVAEQFRVLEAIAPGRIDLGVGRAPGSDRITAQALNPYAGHSGRDEFPGQLRDLMAWVRGDALPEGHPFRSITAEPHGATAPQVWMLGSSDYGAQVAAYFGLPYCYAHFFAPGPDADAKAAQALSVYRENFRPSPALKQPYGAAAVTMFAATSTERAAYETGSRLLWAMRREGGQFGPFPDPKVVAAGAYTPSEQAWMDRALSRQVHGTGEEVARQITALAARLGGCDELFIVSTAFDPAVRQQSFTLLADAMGLTGAQANAAEAERWQPAQRAS